MVVRPYTIDKVKAVILVGGRDFGRCPLASRLNRVLWPILDKPSLQRLIEELSKQGIKRFTVCCKRDVKEIEEGLNLPSHIQIRFVSERFPRGTAGSLKEAVEQQDELVFVLPSCVLTAPDVVEMISAHRQSQAEMTAFLNPPQENESPTLAQIFICEKAVIDQIPSAGYFDLKEGLIPRMVKDGIAVASAVLASRVESYSTWQDYLNGINGLISSFQKHHTAWPQFRELEAGGGIWIGRDVTIDASARIVGPVVLDSGCRVEQNAVIAGPALIGSRSMVGAGALLDKSVVWSDSHIGANCRLQECLVDDGNTVAAGTQHQRSLLGHSKGIVGCSRKVVIGGWNYLASLSEKNSVSGLDYLQTPAAGRWMGFCFLAVLAVFLASYFQPTLIDLWKNWNRSDEYSSGMLVPFLICWVLWLRRNDYLSCGIYPSLAGAAGLIAAQGIRLWGHYYMYSSIENASLVLSAASLVLLLFGWQALGRLWPIILFLALMFPLPNRVASSLTLPLQERATSSAVFVLETFGFNAIRQGNVIDLDGTKVAVAEACNGLRMLTAFFVVSGLIALLIRKSWWEKAILLISSIPIALLCNTIRLSATAVAFKWIDVEKWEKAFHDYGGVAMMPLAIAMMVAELWILSHLFVTSWIVFERHRSR